MRILFLLFLFMPIICYGQITKPGVQAENGGSVLGRALTVNCDNVCIVCSLSGTTLSISLSGACSGGGGSTDLLLEDGSYLLLETTPGGKMIL
jgi:hypothetical protein